MTRRHLYIAGDGLLFLVAVLLILITWTMWSTAVAATTPPQPGEYPPAATLAVQALRQGAVTLSIWPLLMAVGLWGAAHRRGRLARSVRGSVARGVFLAWCALLMGVVPLLAGGLGLILLTRIPFLPRGWSAVS